MKINKIGILLVSMLWASQLESAILQSMKNVLARLFGSSKSNKSSTLVPIQKVGTPLEASQQAQAVPLLSDQINSTNTALNSNTLTLEQSTTLLTQAIGVLQNAIDKGTVSAVDLPNYKKQLSSYKSKLTSAENQLQAQGVQTHLDSVKGKLSNQQSANKSQAAPKKDVAQTAAQESLNQLINVAKNATMAGSTETDQAQLTTVHKAIGAVSGAVKVGQVKQGTYKQALQDLQQRKANLTASIQKAAVEQGVKVPKSTLNDTRVPKGP